MPIFTFQTNVEACKVTEQLLIQTTEVLAEAIQKPASKIQVIIIPDQRMTMGGSTEPCGYGTVVSIGKISNEENKKYTAALMDHFHKYLQISPERVYLFFTDAKPENIGWNGTTRHSWGSIDEAKSFTALSDANPDMEVSKK